MAISHSLIVTTYNRPDALGLVLQSIANQTILPDEIIIADDGSNEDTAQLIKSYLPNLPKLQHVWQEDNGFRLSAIRNKAISQCNSDFISMIDGDMMLHPRFIEDIKNHIQPNYYLQGKRVLLLSQLTSLLLEGHKVPINFFTPNIINRINTLSIPFLSKIISRRYNKIEGVRGCSMHFWKKNAKAVNAFNEVIVGWGREDSEFLQRLLNHGVRRKNIALGAVAYHLYHQEASRDLLNQNDNILSETIAQKKVWCDLGLQKG